MRWPRPLARGRLDSHGVRDASAPILEGGDATSHRRGSPFLPAWLCFPREVRPRLPGPTCALGLTWDEPSSVQRQSRDCPCRGPAASSLSSSLIPGLLLVTKVQSDCFLRNLLEPRCLELSLAAAWLADGSLSGLSLQEMESFASSKVNEKKVSLV